VQDTIWESTTWNADTIKVGGDIFIVDSATLIIEAGTYVKFMGYYGIRCNGIIEAIGTGTDSIIFSVSDTNGFHDPNTENGGWNSIYISSGIVRAQDTNVFSHCLFNYLKSEYAIPLYSSAPVVIQNSSFF